nr:DUF350 domain-containing protein [uncultured Agathobacter sp.]
MLTVILESAVYLCVGLIIMMIGHWIIDLIIPVDFPQEINDGNKAVGWVSAGIYAGIGFVIRSAIISNTISEDVSLLTGSIDTLVYATVGIVAFIIGYFVVDIINKKFNFNKALKEKNEAAGIMVFGIFVGIAFIVSGVIQ